MIRGLPFCVQHTAVSWTNPKRAANSANGRGWYYGLDGNPGVGQVDFVTVAVHEILHGLGFISLVDKATGAKFGGLDDVYSFFLRDGSTGRSWSVMTDAERQASATDTSDLLWMGADVSSIAPGFSSGASHGRVQMFAPSIVEFASSVSHFDQAATPDQLMEPFYLGPNHELGAAAELLSDLGWSVVCESGFIRDLEGDCVLTCPVGQQGTVNVDVECTDVDEWTSNTDNCDINASCTNTSGSFSCACAAGYIGDGTTCSLGDVCGNGVLESGEDCDDGNDSGGDCCSPTCEIEVAGAVCREAVGSCDAVETCDGVSGSCPSDAALPPGSECRPSAGSCDPAESCNGFANTCPADMSFRMRAVRVRVLGRCWLPRFFRQVDLSRSAAAHRLLPR